MNTIDHPWLTVVMPVYNGENYLAFALESILSQPPDGIEIVAVDGGSTDRTIEIFEDYADRLPLKLSICEHLETWVAKTNHGLSLARGDFVCFLHHDDLWLKDRLGALRRLVDMAPQVTMFLHPSWFIDPAGRRVGTWRCPLPGDTELGPGVVIERLLVQNFISMPAPLFSRQAALRVGGLDAELWYTADWDFWLKLAAAGRTLYHPRPLSAFRIHREAQTIQGSSHVSEFRRQQEIVLARHLGAGELARAGNSLGQRVARFSIELNTGLAAFVHGRESSPLGLFARFLRLGPAGWHRYLRDSRIIERALPRYRIGLARPEQPISPCPAQPRGV
jgi:glycosyltransferase involved in cell wall biosynthesis